MIDVDHLNTIYQYIITTFLLNTMLHHFYMLCIIETHDQLQYYLDKQNSEWITGGPWYNTYICKKLHGKVFEGYPGDYMPAKIGRASCRTHGIMSVSSCIFNKPLNKFSL